MEIKGSDIKLNPEMKEAVNQGKELAKDIKLFAAGCGGALSYPLFHNKLNSIQNLSAEDLVKFVRSFDKKESIIELICDEISSDKESRKDGCRRVLKALINKANELGIETKDFEHEFIKEMNHQFNSWSMVNTNKLDKIIDILTQAIENRQNFTAEDVQIVQNTSVEEGQTKSNQAIENRLEQAYSAFGERVGEDGEMTTKDKNGNLYDGQMQRDGIAADTADFISKIWGSENTADKVRADLKVANKQLQELQEAKTQGEDAYKAKFKEIFGIEYSYPTVFAYQKAEKAFVEAKANHDFEMSFNRTLKTLLSAAPLREEIRYDSADPSTSVVIPSVTSTKEQVFDREFKALAGYLGKNGNEILNKAFEEKGVASGTIEEKFEVMKQIAQALSKQLHSATLEAGNGKEFSEMETMYNNSYKAAYGLENDIIKRVTDYNVSQETGAAFVKIGANVAITLGAAFSGIGLPALAALTAGGAIATEVVDRGTSGKALDALREQGLGEYLDAVGDDVDWEATLKQAAIGGGAVLIGGGVAQGVTAIMKGSSSVAQFAAMLGSDVVTDAALELMTTKQITWQNMVFTVLLSAIGNAVALKQMDNVADDVVRASSVESGSGTADFAAKLAEFKGPDGKPLLSKKDINVLFENCQYGGRQISDYEDRILAILSNPEEIADIARYKSKAAGVWQALKDPFDSTIKLNPAAFGVEPKVGTVNKAASTTPVGNQCVLPKNMKYDSGNIGDVTVKVASGDLTTVKADAYLVPEFNSCVSEGGVGGAIWRNGGSKGLDAYEQIIKTQGKQEFGTVHITESGGGNSSKLIHAVTVGSGAENEFEVVQKAVYNALKSAEEQGLSSVAMPALGTGIIGNLTNEQSAQAMMSAIRQFTNEGGKIRIAIEQKRRRARLLFENTVECLPNCPPENLFDRFYRGDSARTQSGGGCGIGLSAARAIAEIHRGSISAEYFEDNTIRFAVDMYV